MTPKQMVESLDGQLTDCYAEIEVKNARIAELEAANDAAEAAGEYSDGGLWRFWSEKSLELANKSKADKVRIAKLEGAVQYIAEHAGQTGFKQPATHENATLIGDFARAALGDGA